MLSRYADKTRQLKVDERMSNNYVYRDVVSSPGTHCSTWYSGVF